MLQKLKLGEGRHIGKRGVRGGGTYEKVGDICNLPLEGVNQGFWSQLSGALTKIVHVYLRAQEEPAT